jgi:hypothetical protein
MIADAGRVSAADGNLPSLPGVEAPVVVRPLNDPGLADGELVERAQRGDVSPSSGPRIS